MKKILCVAATLAAMTCLYACSDDHTDDHPHDVPTDGDGGHTSPYASCNAITQACHSVDVGEGPIHDCHEIGHDAKSDAPCAAEKDRCLALCADAAGDGGSEASTADAAARD